MKPEDILALSFYKEISKMKGRSNISLVQHIETGVFYVKKTLELRNKEIVTRLMKNNFKFIPKIYECIESDNHLVVIEEYINGPSLDTILADQGPFSLNESTRLIASLCDILTPLHQLEPPIIHRYIKPANLLLHSDGTLFLIDFDAAKQFDAAKNEDTILMGTADYAAPEQFGFSQSTPRTDIFSMGVLTNYFLTGALPKEKLYSGPLTPIIKKCIELNPADRYASADQLKQQLLGTPTASKPASNTNPSRFLPPGFRTRTPWKMLLALLGYSMLGYGLLTADFTDIPPSEVVAYQVFTGFLVLSLICFFTNYLNMQRLFPFYKKDRKTRSLIKGSMFLFWSLIIFFALLMAFFT